MEDIIQTLAIFAIPVIFSLTLKEAAIGFAAAYLGDPSPKLNGRLSLNPSRHLDWVGTVIAPMVTLALVKSIGGGLLFGWAKPMPFDARYFKNPRKGLVTVIGAGLSAYFSMALAWAFLGSAMKALDVDERFFYLVAQAGVSFNIMLLAISLLPIPPLDGGRLLVLLLPRDLGLALARVEPYGSFIVMALLITGIIGPLLFPLYGMVAALVHFIAGF
jgi:Zn-dependent protease